MRMAPNNQFAVRGMRPGMMPPNLQKSVLQNNTQNMYVDSVLPRVSLSWMSLCPGN